MKFKKLLVFLAMLLGFVSTYGEILLPALLSDGVVLQQNTRIKVWGWCHPGDSIKLVASWSDSVYVCRANEMSYWLISIQTPKGGFDVHSLQLSSNNDIKIINDILFGEVWLCSGQSNMEWGVQNGHQEMIDELPNSKNNQIRLFHVPKIASVTEQEDIKGSWRSSGPQFLMNFSSIGYFAAKKLYKKLNLPIGIINASWGGTSCEMWLPKEIVLNDTLLSFYAENIPYYEHRPNQIGSCWNAMISPLTNFRIAGVFWYQGESNVWTWQSYDKLFKSLISSWREAWDFELPFYYVQIAPFEYGTGEKAMAAELREKQNQVLSVPKTGVVVTTDLVDNLLDIHPKFKKDVAFRLVDMALAEVYNYQLIDYKSPIYSHSKVSGKTVKIYFKFLTGRLKWKGCYDNEFFVAGDDMEFHKANFKINKDHIEIVSDWIESPRYVKFGFSDAPKANLFNSNNLPVSPFFVKL